MNTSAERIQENKSQSIANNLGQREASSRFVDNRQETVAQRSMQVIANNRSVSQNAIQLKLGSSTYPGREQHKAGLFPQTGHKSVVQRMLIMKLGKNDDDEDVVKVSTNTKRPSTGLPGGVQGDHTTPFAVLQDQLQNAVAELTLDQAWEALDATYNVYQSLPGWPFLLKKFHPDRDDVVLKLATEGDIVALNIAANRMLALRQKIPFTNILNGGRGQAEGYRLSGIRLAERKLQLNTNAVLDKSVTKEAIMFDMIKAFDAKRAAKIKNAKRKADILLQHCMTIVDAYPLLSSKFGITAGRLYNRVIALKASNTKKKKK